MPLDTMAIITTVVIANLGNAIVAPVMSPIRDEFNSTAAQVGLVASGFGIGRLAMDLPAGWLNDRLSGNRMLTLGILISATSAALAATSTTLEQLILFRTLMGVGSSTVSTVALVLLVRIAPPERRSRVLAMFSTGMLFGQAISPSIGGYLATLFTWKAAFVFCALTPLLSFPLNMLVSSRTPLLREPVGMGGKRPRRSRGGQAGAVAPATANLPALAAVFFATFVNFFDRHAMRASLLPLFAGGVLAMDPGSIGTILTTGSVATILLTMPVGTAADKIGRKPLLIPGMLTLAAGNLVMLLGASPTLFVMSVVLVSFGVLANTIQSGLVADLTPESMLGRNLSLYRFACDLGVVAGPFLMGLVYDRYGFTSAMLLGAGTVAVSVVACILLIPRRTLIPAPQER